MGRELQRSATNGNNLFPSVRVGTFGITTEELEKKAELARMLVDGSKVGVRLHM